MPRNMRPAPPPREACCSASASAAAAQTDDVDAVSSATQMARGVGGATTLISPLWALLPVSPPPLPEAEASSPNVELCEENECPPPPPLPDHRRASQAEGVEELPDEEEAEEEGGGGADVAILRTLLPEAVATAAASSAATDGIGSGAVDGGLGTLTTVAGPGASMRQEKRRTYPTLSKGHANGCGHRTAAGVGLGRVKSKGTATASNVNRCNVACTMRLE